MTKSRGILPPRCWWTPVEERRLRRMYPSRSTHEVAEKLGRTVATVYRKARDLGLRKSEKYLASPAACRLRRGDNIGAPFRFKKGHVPANKGMRRPGWHSGRMRETQFKKGRPPETARNYLPIGSLRMSKDGYLERKVTDAHPVPARRWVGVHRLVWEAANGPVPGHHAVCFLPGLRTAIESEITLDRLELVHRRELMLRNTLHRFPEPIPQLIQLRGALRRQINKRTRRDQEHDGRSARSPVCNDGRSA